MTPCVISFLVILLIGDRRLLLIPQLSSGGGKLLQFLAFGRKIRCETTVNLCFTLEESAVRHVNMPV